MKIKEIRPIANINATVSAPPSKSYTNRALIIAALAEGTSRLATPLISDDTKYMQKALDQYGISVREEEDHTLVVNGNGSRLQTPGETLFVGNAGTTMRFLTTFAALAPGNTRLDGDERMHERPIQDLLDCLQQMGVKAVSENNNQCPPLKIPGGGIPGGSIELAGDKSSQYLTSILMCAPYFENDTEIKILGDLTSKSYVNITLDIMKTFGVTVENESYQHFRVRAGQRYRAMDYSIEGDASSASYFFGAAAIAGGTVSVTHLNPQSVQGDMGFVDVLEQMGCEVTREPQKITLKANPLQGISINMNNMPDVVQTLGVVALFADGPTHITGIGNLRIKETDRIAALSQELSRLGAEVTAGEDYLTIQPGNYTGAEIETYHDHRMAMSFALAGLKVPGVKIKNPDCVNKSFPDFFDRFNIFYERS